MEELGVIPNTALTSGNPEAQEVSRRGRTLVLCFDGTAGQYDNDNSNVVKIFALLTKDPNEQLCYYQPGVGTWFKPGVVSPLLHWCAKVLDRAIAWYLHQHVLDGYKFIMQNYRSGDQICLFGFSRGAYTARALAGMLHKVGLLPRDNDVQLPFAFELYRREDEEGLKFCDGFKRTYCQNVEIAFMGLWDTVASVGVIAGRTLPFTNSNRSVKFFRHALSLDEHRARYRPNLYHRMTPAFAANTDIAPEPSLRARPPSNSSSSSSSSSSSGSPEEVASKKKKSIIRVGGKKPSKKTKATNGITTEEKGKSSIIHASEVGPNDDFLEVWFAGVHSDVGGGSVKNEEKHSLSHISLRWMVRQAAASRCGIKFDAQALARAGINLHYAEGELDELDRMDASEKIYDKLKIYPMWWILEVVPMSYAWQDKDGVWHKTWRPHFGKGRKIETDQPKFHESVRVRREELDYKPRAEWEEGTEIYVR